MSEPKTETANPCPKCGAEMEHIDQEPDVGIMAGNDVCTNDECGHSVDDDFDDPIGDEAI